MVIVRTDPLHSWLHQAVYLTTPVAALLSTTRMPDIEGADRHDDGLKTWFLIFYPSALTANG